MAVAHISLRIIYSTWGLTEIRLRDLISIMRKRILSSWHEAKVRICDIDAVILLIVSFQWGFFYSIFSTNITSKKSTSKINEREMIVHGLIGLTLPSCAQQEAVIFFLG